MRPALSTTLIETWLPIAELGAESQRERGVSSALPSLYFLHVWWARRPLIVSRAAVVASLLPQWHKGWPAELLKKFPTIESYKEWFLRIVGIIGDPVRGRALIQDARDKGIKLPGNPYGYPRAFGVNPTEEQLETLLDLLEYQWGTRDISVLDPMAGGGSIPFEAIRYGFTTFANELNPVASIILKATLEYPARFGKELSQQIKKWGGIIDEKASAILKEFFPMKPGERIRRYLWSRTVACPTTGKPVPLSPNWWLQKGNSPVAVSLCCEEEDETVRFEIVRGRAAMAANPDEGTVNRGVGKSPWTGESIDGDYIKAEAQAGRMGQQLYALSIQKDRERDFRAPSEIDLAAVARAEAALKEKLPTWETKGLIPIEERYVGPADRTANYGMRRWVDAFAPRQLLALATYLEIYKDVVEEIRNSNSQELSDAILTYLGFVIDKAVDRNSRQCIWIPQRQVLSHSFLRHDFSLKWSHGEMTLPTDGFLWAIDQVVDSFEGISSLSESTRSPLFTQGGVPVIDRLKVTQGNAASLPDLKDESIKLICVDPPYLDNVMYAELSDFYYVWLKRTVGDIYPEWFNDELTNKDDEAVANVARFAQIAGRKKKVLAEQDYQRKMAACFKEMNRVLHPDGILTVMFTHKRVDAWDTLAMALIEAGFSIWASWPVHTEYEKGLHQNKKNVASSTILLVCRKRRETEDPVWWDDLKSQVREKARSKAAEFEKQGIRGVDLYISTFGPVLSIISRNWPVLTSEVDEKTGQPKPLSPSIALDLAREEIIALRKQGLLLGRSVDFDPITDWYLMAWDAFKAEQFPADEARKLAIALGLDLEADVIRAKRVVTKKQAFVAFQEPKNRRRRGAVDPEQEVFDCLLDAVHTAMLVYDEDGSRACEQFLQKSGLLADATFRSCIQALLNAVPRTKKDGQFLRPEARLLENLRMTFFDDIEAPPEEEPPDLAALQKTFDFPGQKGEESEAEVKEASEEGANE